jgi:hypothetical protein
LGHILGECIDEMVEIEVQRETYRERIGLAGPMSESILLSNKGKQLGKEQPKKMDI